MGSSASKATTKAGQAAGSAARKYPSRPPPPQATTNTSSRPSPPSETTNAPSSRPLPGQRSQPGPTVRPQARASGERSEAINLDASDPDFARSLRSLGAVQPNPTLSNTSTFNSTANTQFNPSIFPSSPSYPSPNSQNTPNPRLNPALQVLASRSRLADEAQKEFDETGKRGDQGRSFLDVGTIRSILTMRARGKTEEEIERQFGLRKGVVGRLGPKGVFDVDAL